jgi:hypothetical protein
MEKYDIMMYMSSQFERRGGSYKLPSGGGIGGQEMREAKETPKKGDIIIEASRVEQATKILEDADIKGFDVMKYMSEQQLEAGAKLPGQFIIRFEDSTSADLAFRKLRFENQIDCHLVKDNVNVDEGKE